MENDLEDIAIRLQGIIDTAIDGIITIDTKGRIETINNAAATQFGYKPNEVITKNVKVLMPEPYHSEHDGYIHRYNTTKKPHIIGIGREVVGQRKDGSQFPFRLAVSEVILNDRVIYTGIIHDLTEVKRAEDKLKMLNEDLENKVQDRTNELESVVNKLLGANRVLEQKEAQLKEALKKEKDLNELKSRFVSMASHEFRTPLSTILSSASLISRYVGEQDNEKRQKHTERIKSSVTHLTDILNDFLSLSKIEEGKVQIAKERLNLNELCLVVQDEVEGLLKKGQKLHLDHENGGLFVMADKRVLKNILFNLISNAIKYSPENSDISCKISLRAGMVLFEITDKGIGIPEADQKYLFTRFFRSTNVESIQGTGLGLSIVKRYVELLGGSISFESQEGKGSTFRFELPQKG